MSCVLQHWCLRNDWGIRCGAVTVKICHVVGWNVILLSLMANGPITILWELARKRWNGVRKRKECGRRILLIRGEPNPTWRNNHSLALYLLSWCNSSVGTQISWKHRMCTITLELVTGQKFQYWLMHWCNHSCYTPDSSRNYFKRTEDYKTLNYVIVCHLPHPRKRFIE